MSLTLKDSLIRNVQDSLQNDFHGAPRILLIHIGTNNLTIRTQVEDIVLDLSVMTTEALTRFSSSRILYPTIFPLPDIPTSTKSKINNQLVAKCSIPLNMHFVSHVNLFTKGMDVLKDDRLIRKRYIGLFATNLLNTFYGNSNILPTHPPKPPNERILQAHSQQLSPLPRYTCNELKNLPPETCQVTPHSLLPQYMQTEHPSTITLNVNTPAIVPQDPLQSPMRTKSSSSIILCFGAFRRKHWNTENTNWIASKNDHSSSKASSIRWKHLKSTHSEKTPLTPR